MCRWFRSWAPAPLSVPLQQEPVTVTPQHEDFVLMQPTSEGFSRPRFVLLLTTHLKGWTLPYQMHLCFSQNVKIFHNRVFREKIEAQLCCLPLHPVDGTDTALCDSQHLCSLWVGDRPRRERAPDLYSRCEFIFSLEKSF